MFLNISKIAFNVFYILSECSVMGKQGNEHAQLNIQYRPILIKQFTNIG